MIGLAIEVHAHTSLSLLESIYEQCLCRELRKAGIPFVHQAAVPVNYKSIPISDRSKTDIVREVILGIRPDIIGKGAAAEPSPSSYRLSVSGYSRLPAPLASYPIQATTSLTSKADQPT